MFARSIDSLTITTNAFDGTGDALDQFEGNDDEDDDALF
jgi:hypothetical protein